jgi:hypothetical protein
MIVWGGASADLSIPPNAGGLYIPASDSWLPISMGANSPASRYYHTAVWTGTEMIVWGGEPGTATGGRYCACPSGRLVYRDSDGDGYGDPGVSIPSCDGSAPPGYVADHSDCNDAISATHPGAVETCNGIDDDCNRLVDEVALTEDADGDQVHDLCDNCRFAANASQSDFDHDGEGDACDLNDGLIYERRDDKTSVSWQAEQGPTSWNVYIGDLDVLRATGVYTQVPDSNALADRRCGVIALTASDSAIPDPGRASFSQITGVTGGVESSLGSSSTGPRPNANPCP